MATFVLVHGAWSGAHTFHRVRPLIRAAGHEVFTPSLTGIGERIHLSSPQVNLTTHVTDVVNTILYEDLTDIVLLGFSYGGCVVTGAIDEVADRVGHLVYLDAFLPEDGQRLVDIGPRLAPAEGGGLGGGWLVPPLPRAFEDPVEGEWIGHRRVPHPLGCFLEPVRLRTPLEEHRFSRTYIKATGEPRPASGGPFWTAGDRAKHSPAWRYREIATDHMIPVNRPEELVELLLELA